MPTSMSTEPRYPAKLEDLRRDVLVLLAEKRIGQRLTTAEAEHLLHESGTIAAALSAMWASHREARGGTWYARMWTWFRRLG